MRIIIVDDETAPMHLFLEETLRFDRDVDYHYFHDDEKAILSYAQNGVDGAFLDIRMPRIDGISLAAKLIKIAPRIQIVFVTGYNKTMDDLPASIKKNVLGIAFKPLSADDFERYMDLIKHTRPVLIAKTFGSFDCFVHNRVVHFSSSKSKELFAFLVVHEGKSVSMEAAITALWPDKDVAKAKILYRDAVWRLRSTLKEIGMECVDFSRALLTLDTKDIECDYYDLLRGKNVPYGGEFLTSYEWSLPMERSIERYLGLDD